MVPHQVSVQVVPSVDTGIAMQCSKGLVNFLMGRRGWCFNEGSIKNEQTKRRVQKKIIGAKGGPEKKYECAKFFRSRYARHSVTKLIENFCHLTTLFLPSQNPF